MRRRSANLRQFDKLSFAALNKDAWELFADLHTVNVVAEAGGERSEGIDAHVEQSKRFLAQTPGGRVTGHPISFASGAWTCTVAELATGRKMSIICRWRDGRIAEEYVFS